MRNLLQFVVIALVNLSMMGAALADPPPDLKIIGTGATIFNVQGVNDSGQVLLLMQDGTGVLWTNGAFAADREAANKILATLRKAIAS